MTTITTIIPTYNRENFIGEALESVLTQSHPVNEIIVIDDGSTDNTQKILQSFSRRIHCIWQKNKGPGAARNRGIKEASGFFISFLDSDDLWTREKTRTQLDFFDKHPQVDLVFGDMANFTENDGDNGAEIRNKAIHDYLETHSENLEKILDCLIQEDIIPTPSVMIKREAVYKIGFFDETLRIGEDYDYWLRASRVCRIGFVNKVLVKRRIHGDNLVNDWLNRNIADMEVLSRIGSAEFAVPIQTQKLLEDKLSRIHYDLGSHYFKKKDYNKAYFYLHKKRPSKSLKHKWLTKLFFSFLLHKVSVSIFTDNTS